MCTIGLAERIEKLPQLKLRFEEMLKIAENTDGSIERADDAEEMIMKVGRDLNKVTLQIWAEKQAIAQAQNFEQRHRGAHKDIKKN